MKLNGQGVSPGIGIGRAIVVTRGTANLRFRIPDRRIEGELLRLDTARNAACCTPSSEKPAAQHHEKLRKTALSDVKAGARSD